MSKFKLSATQPQHPKSSSLTAEQFTSGAALVQTQNGGRPPKPVRINFDLDPDTHRSLKIRAINQGVTVAELIRNLIAKELAK